MPKFSRTGILAATAVLLASVFFVMSWEFAAAPRAGQTATVAEPLESPPETVPPMQQQPSSEATSTPQEAVTDPVPKYSYIEVTESCGPYWGGECVNMREGPGTSYPVVSKLRTGVVLRVADSVTENGETWYRIAQEDSLRYPERITSDWYVSADVVRLFQDDGDHDLAPGQTVSTTKRILVDKSDEMLYAYDGDTLFMQTPISTGLELSPTPNGTFRVFKMKPSRYMQGPIEGIPGSNFYDLPGVPWNLYFTHEGAVIHGAYWHDKFGQQWSHGCVNLPLDKAKELYMWAEIGIPVTVRE